MSCSDWDDEFEVIVNRFLEALAPLGSFKPWITNNNVAYWLPENAYVEFCSQIHLIEGDEDEDFTYGALCTVLAQFKHNESDWLLIREFGCHYSLRHISAVDLTDNE